MDHFCRTLGSFSLEYTGSGTSELDPRMYTFTLANRDNVSFELVFQTSSLYSTFGWAANIGISLDGDYIYNELLPTDFSTNGTLWVKAVSEDGNKTMYYQFNVMVPFAGLSDFTVSSTNASGVSWNSPTLNITQSGTYHITGTGTATTHRISVSGNNTIANIVLKDVNINISSISDVTAFSITSNATVYLTLLGVNTLSSGSGRAGLSVPAGTSLVITEASAGSLTAIGGNWGAGIGSHSIPNINPPIIINSGTIKIKGGTVTATGGSVSAGIGSSTGGSVGLITITEGTVFSTGGSGGAGIGGGSGSSSNTILITGGTITATGGNVGISSVYGGAGGGAGIGGGGGGNGGTIDITGGNVTSTGGRGGSSSLQGGGGGGGSGIGGGGASGGNGSGAGSTNGMNGGGGGAINITSTDVTTTGGFGGTGTNNGSEGAGIGGGGGGGRGGGNGGSTGNAGSLTINNAIIFSSSIMSTLIPGNNVHDSIVFIGTNGTLYGDFILTRNFTLSAGRVLSIASGRSLSIPSNVILQNNGTIRFHGVINGTVIGNQPIPPELPISGDMYYSYTGEVLTITGNGTFTIIMRSGLSSTTQGRIVVASGVNANITLSDVNINLSAINNISAFDMTGATVNLTLVGENVLRSGSGMAGLTVPSGSNLLITENSTGSLSSTGGSNSAGIGGGINGGGGTVSITGGIVTSTGGTNGAGIGGGANGGGSAVNITGGIVTTNSGINAFGIGRGSGFGSAGQFTSGNNAVVFANSIQPTLTEGNNVNNSIIFNGNNGNLYGNIVLQNDVTIAVEQILLIPSERILTIPDIVILTNNGIINNNGMIIGNVTGNQPVLP